MPFETMRPKVLHMTVIQGTLATIACCYWKCSYQISVPENIICNNYIICIPFFSRTCRWRGVHCVRTTPACPFSRSERDMDFRSGCLLHFNQYFAVIFCLFVVVVVLSQAPGNGFLPVTYENGDFIVRRRICFSSTHAYLDWCDLSAL